MTQDVLTLDTPSHATNTQPQKSPAKNKKRYLKRDPWLEEPFNSARGEKALWVAVITHAMMDALSQSRNPEVRHHRQSAINWLTGNSKDFITVCLFAGMDPDYVRKKAKKTLANPVAWRAAPGKGKRYSERKAYRTRIKTRKKPSDDGSAAPAKAIVLHGPWN